MEDNRILLVPFESWAYLKNRSREERLGKKISEVLLRQMYEIMAKKDDLAILNGKSLGGKTDGEVTTWTIDDLKGMLDAQGLSYREAAENE
jgi:hypothetical protein